MTHRLAPAAAAATGRRLRLSTEMLSLMRKTSECFSEGRCARKALERAAGAARSRVLFLWGAAPWEPESLVLAACAGGPPAANEALPLPAPEVLDPTRRLLDLWADREVHPVPAPPVDGEILMREFGLEPGPRVGEALREVRLAWEAGEATTMGEAMNVAAKVLRVA
jgi:hypothetical protein